MPADAAAALCSRLLRCTLLALLCRHTQPLPAKHSLELRLASQLQAALERAAAGRTRRSASGGPAGLPQRACRVERLFIRWADINWNVADPPVGIDVARCAGGCHVNEPARIDMAHIHLVKLLGGRYKPRLYCVAAHMSHEQVVLSDGPNYRVLKLAKIHNCTCSYNAVAT